MAIVYTNSWQAGRSDSYDSREFGTVAFIIATAGETLTPVNITTATHQTTGVPLPKVGDVSSLDTRYFVHSVSVPRFEGPRAASVAIGYKLGKGSGEQEDEDPLNTPVRYRVRNGITSEPTDADVNGKALLNSAGDPFGGTVTTNIASIYIDVIRNEPSYNLPQAISFTNKVNGDVFSLAGYPINPGEAYCLGIQPESDYKLDDTYVSVVYSYELRERLTVLPGGGRVTAFIHRLLDQGKRGWAYSGEGEGATLQEVFSNGGVLAEPSPVTSDILLKDGIPLDRASYRTANDNFSEDDGRGWVEQLPPGKAPNATRHIDPETEANFLLYQKHLTANMAELALP